MSPECDVEAIETAIGVSLPTAYREFLVECGGWYREVECPFLEPTPFGEKHVIAEFHDAAEVRGLLGFVDHTEEHGHDRQQSLREVHLPIRRRNRRGSVYALDGEFRVYWDDDEFHQRFNAMADSIREYLDLRREDNLPDKPAGYDSIYLLAESFDEFISKLRSYSADG